MSGDVREEASGTAEQGTEFSPAGIHRNAHRHDLTEGIPRLKFTLIALDH
jgi:hypothetical protein